MDRTARSRRDFLRTASMATLSALAAGTARRILPAAQEPPPGAGSRPRADSVIILWMAGGMAQTETFDPKEHTPFEKGLESKRVLSTFPSIPTAVDGIRISEGLDRIGKVLDRGSLIRSFVFGDLGFILHSRHQYHWHTGYVPPQTVAAPHIGAVIARTLGPINPAVPAFIDIGQRLDLGEGEELKAFHTAGFLGSEHGPFMIASPEAALETVRPPRGMTPARFADRYAFYRKLAAESPIGMHGSGYQKESLLRSIENAHRLLASPAAKAFDLSLETEKVRAVYNTGRFGLGCLLARRLVERGARFIEVTTEYEPFKHWDTHENGHTRMADLKRMIDAPVAQLILDLEERGLLDRTIVVLASEFGRDMITEGKPEKPVQNQVEVPAVMAEMKHYGMHRHFTSAGSVLVFGGGFRKGHLHGRTADERPCAAIEKPVSIEDFHATLYKALGISPKLSYEVERRPFYVTRDGLGKPVEELFA